MVSPDQFNTDFIQSILNTVNNIDLSSVISEYTSCFEEIQIRMMQCKSNTPGSLITLVASLNSQDNFGMTPTSSNQLLG